MTEQKKPQDKKASKEELARYSFEYNGETYDMAEGKSFADVVRPGFFRKNRGKSEDEVTFNMLETLYTEGTLSETVDEMTMDEFQEFAQAFGEAFQAYAGATPGES